MLTTRTIGAKQWTYTSSESSEIETQEFLYGMVRLIKPEVAVETGCHLGDASLSMGLALQKNGLGVLYTCDINHKFVEHTRERTKHLPVVAQEIDSVEMLKAVKNVDFAFIDGGVMRLSELKALDVSPGSYVVLHDANNPLYYEPAMRSGWTAIRFHTPLGLALFEVK